MKLNEYIRITQAADFIGVSQGTLRNWERAGKINPVRHPFNKYRLYKIEELEELMNEMVKDIKKQRRHFLKKGKSSE